MKHTETMGEAEDTATDEANDILNNWLSCIFSMS